MIFGGLLLSGVSVARSASSLILSDFTILEGGLDEGGEGEDGEQKG